MARHKKNGLPPGRHSRCTPDLCDKIASMIRRGCNITAACIIAGIHITSYENWRKWGEAGKKPYTIFVEKIDFAESELQHENDQKWLEFATDKMGKKCTKDGREYDTVLRAGDWRAIESFNSRRWPKKYGQNNVKVKFELKNSDFLSIESINEFSCEILRKTASGEITIENANILSEIVEKRRKTLETSELASRLSKLESEQKNLEIVNVK